MFINFLTKLFCPTPTPHPFRQKTKPQFVQAVDVDTVDNVTTTTWGKDKVVQVVKTSTDKSEEWEVTKKKSVRLKALTLDNFDKAVCHDKNISVVNFRLVKPYVVSGDYSNKDIALILGMSKSWVEGIAPRVREAAANRAKTAPPPTR